MSKINTETHMRIRISNEVRNELINISKSNGRSLNSEVIDRLVKSLKKANELDEIKKMIEAQNYKIASLENKIGEQL